MTSEETQKDHAASAETFARNLLWKWDEQRRHKHKAELKKILDETAKGSDESDDR